MPVAVLSDIHGNLPALEAALAEIEPLGVDVVVCGDVVTGPFSAEVFDLITSLPGVRFVRGNVESLVVDGIDEHGQDWSIERARLGSARLAEVASWPLTLEVEIGGLGTALACHSTPRSNEPIYTRVTPDDELVALLGDVGAYVLLCGHTHVQYDRTLSSGLRVVNAGSVGMPYEGLRGAFWALLGPDVEHRHTEYDVDAAVERIRAHGAPVEERQVELLLEPMTSEAATAEFEQLRGA